MEKRYVKEIKQLKNEINQLNDEKLSLQALSNELRINLSSLIDQTNNKNVSYENLVCNPFKIDLLQHFFGSVVYSKIVDVWKLFV